MICCLDMSATYIEILHIEVQSQVQWFVEATLSFQRLSYGAGYRFLSERSTYTVQFKFRNWERYLLKKSKEPNKSTLYVRYDIIAFLFTILFTN